MQNHSRITIIGNSCGGKTQVSRQLSKRYNLPLIHVDQIQFMEGLKFRPYKESIQLLQVEQDKPQWIIDGFGPLDILEDRLKKSDWIIMIDLPLWVHYWWATKRVFRNLFFTQRAELPAHSSERNLEHIFKLYKTIHQIHTKMRPEMLRILQRDQFKSKTLLVKSKQELNSLIK